MKKIIGFTAIAAAAGVAIALCNEKIKNSCSEIAQTAKDFAKSTCRKGFCSSKIVLIYDSCPTEHNVVNAECNECICNFTEEVKCFENCGCELVSVLKDYEDKADIITLDAYTATGDDRRRLDDYKLRFGIQKLPAVLMITPTENLIAKLENAVDTAAIKEFLNSHNS